MDHIGVWVLVFLRFCAAQYNICPSGSARRVQNVFGRSRNVQRGVWHLLPCPELRRNEELDGVIWYKGENMEDPSTIRLVSLFSGEVIPGRERFDIRSDFSLVIQGVDDMDGGRYLCEVVTASTEDRIGEVDIRVIGNFFPASTSEASSTSSFQRGRRKTLPCECASQAPDVVYWSTGEDVTTDTHIIGARFSDGATLQIQHGASCSIGSDASLTVNSLNDVQDTQRFWCHVFQSDGTVRNCDTNVQILDEVESASDALKASERSFYLRNDTQQILPCLSWTPGTTACEVEWRKLDNPDRQVLSYNLSTGVVDSSPEFDLASDFGLMIQSVDDDHAGVYRCAVGDENLMDVEIRVIGDRFPLDDGIAVEGDNVTFKPISRFSLQCPAFSDIPLTAKATLFWSFGDPDPEPYTTVIGTLNLPDGPKKIYYQVEDCLGITMEGALLLNNCFQDGDVRYWCHVFPATDDLIRSYVDVFTENSNGNPEQFNVTAIAVCVPLFVIVLLGIVVFLMWKRRRRSLHHREDNEKGDHITVHELDPVMELGLMTLAKKVKSFVISKLSRIPITPWIDLDDASFAPIDTVYKPLEMFANVSYVGITVKYQLDSESDIFDDGIPELASKHAIIQGRRGCGKTTFLYRLIYDWAMGRQRALWGSDQIVVLVPAWLLIKAKTIGEAVVECMLPKDANISAKSINAHYARDKSNLTILVDDCNDKDDIDTIMKIVADNEFPCCQLVLTTRNSELATATSRKYDMRHITITGFALRNAIEYVTVVLDTAVKSDAEPETGLTADIHKKRKKRNLHRYLKKESLEPKVSCLPAVLVALCQISILTKGEAFKPDDTMAKMFLTLVENMVNKNKTLDEGVSEGNQPSLPTKDQVNFLEELGRVVYSKLLIKCPNDADFSKEDFLNMSENGEHVLDVAMALGFLRPFQVESKVESKKKSIERVRSEVSEVRSTRGFLCCTRKGNKQTEQDHMSQDTELTPLTSPKVERVYFVLEILEELCVAQFVARWTKRKVGQLVDDIPEIDHTKIANIFQFAIQDNQFDREALVDCCAKIINRGYSQVSPLHVVLQLQKFVELCLQLNFEGQCEGALNKKLKSIFPDWRVRLIGISSYKLHLMSYLLKYAQPEDKSKLNVKSVELLRIGRYDWLELQEYIEYFAPGQKGYEKQITVETNPEDNHTDTSGIHQGRGPAQEPQSGEENKCDDLSLPTQSQSEASAPGGEDANEAESTEWSVNGDVESCRMNDIKNGEHVLKKLRERITFSNQDMPQFPPDESDISVLHNVRYFGLQEFLESQVGECYSSGAARDLARYLPRLEMLESLVLVGTILSSKAICDLANSADQLPNFKKLDLRLNKQFDDRAFVAVTNLLLRECRKLTDLRLSLYKVTDEGFDRVQREMKKDGEYSWGRLKTLYLLHGAPAETFVKFLSNSLKYFHFVKSFHLSARVKEQRIQDNTHEEFEQNIKNPKIMPNLEDLDISNMERLKARMASLKLPKQKKKGPGFSKIIGTTVAGL
ncbi:uncharacterized protein LOC119731983 [Patiria miniata]|uniref:Ig-like domain-containing protein n=1 Tax=Patiria miniata TaxID=46514 RepID=A0A914ACR4_PATMI|nr:uncharacterized protein LOC119731983 [Patiria miniata]